MLNVLRFTFTSDHYLNPLDSIHNPRQTAQPLRLVVVRILWVRQIKHHSTMWLSTTTISKLLCEVNRAVEAQGAIIQDINI